MDPIYDLEQAWLDIFDAGQVEIQRSWKPEQGRGPYYNAGACTQCHFTQNGLGGYPGGGQTHITFYGFSSVGTEGQSQFFPSQGLVLRDSSVSPFPPEELPAWATFTMRRTPQMMGLGLVEAVPDQDFHDLAAANGGKVVVSPETGRVQRWGQQNQFTTLKEFVEAAFVTELGVTPEENAAAVGDGGDPSVTPPIPPIPPNAPELVWQYLLLLDHPKEYVAPGVEEIVEEGEALFDAIGCDNCHTPTLTTGSGPLEVNGMTLDIGVLKDRDFHPYSDYLLHDLGFDPDPVHMGQASGSEYRTAPLWGRRYSKTDEFHDNSETDFDAVIARHGGEAFWASGFYQYLSPSQQNSIQIFVNSR